MKTERTTPKTNWFCNAVRSVLALALIASSLTFSADAEAASRRKGARKSSAKVTAVSKSSKKSNKSKSTDLTVKRVAALISEATPAPISTSAPAVAKTEAEFFKITPEEVKELFPTTDDDIVGKPQFALAEPEKVEAQPITFTAVDFSELAQSEPEATATPAPSTDAAIEDLLEDVPVCEGIEEAVDIGDACEAGDEELAPPEDVGFTEPPPNTSSPMPAELEQVGTEAPVPFVDPQEPPPFDHLFPKDGKPFEPKNPGQRKPYIPHSPQELEKMLRAACRAPGDHPTEVPVRMRGYMPFYDLASWCCQMSAYLHVVAGDACNIPSFMMQCNTGYGRLGNPAWHVISSHACKVKAPSGETVVGTAVMDYGKVIGYLDVCPGDKNKPKGDPSKRMCVYDFNTHQVVKKYERLRFFSQPGCPKTAVGSLVPTAPGNLARSCEEWQLRFGIKVNDPYQVFPENAQPK